MGRGAPGDEGRRQAPARHPPELGFGKQGVGSVVPPNAVLIYELELLAVR
ncbi:MAG TPA: FKBP-type peptidyl-prolyl cis-trans isomerase [Thermoanaerobaculia bacterium]|nr:FKBP-type peptidyl-prolyl cis-trans isomerase [Thermoanaerobaculia bacterium]